MATVGSPPGAITAWSICEPLDDEADIDLVEGMIARHAAQTGSAHAAELLSAWPATRARMVKIIPRDYKRVMMAEARARSENREPAFAELVGAARG